MRVTTTLKHPQGGLLSELLGDDLAARKLAFKVALKKASRGLEQDIEAGLKAAGLPALAPLMASVTYPNRESVGSLNAQAVVYVKAGPVWQQVVLAALDGATIRAHGGKYLAIPTPLNQPAGRFAKLGGPGVADVLVTPRAMTESRAAFLIKRKGKPGYVWMLRVAAEEPSFRNGRRARARVSQSLARLLPGGKRFGALPMFVLIPQVVLKARLNTLGLIAKRFNEVVPRYEEEFRRITRG